MNTLIVQIVGGIVVAFFVYWFNIGGSRIKVVIHGSRGTRTRKIGK